MRVYPFKSLDGADVLTAAFTPRGALDRDRAFALVDDTDAFVNGKREPLVHGIRVTYDDALSRATFRAPSDAHVDFDFDDEPAALEAFFSREFARPIRLRRDERGGFPDDLRAPGPTVVSTATLGEVASWFAVMSADDVRLRLRANIEIGGVPAFWEDRLFGAAETVRHFRVGAAVLGGANPCARCIVPSRDARTGEPLAAFSKRVSERRAATLPTWAERSRFDHFYRLAVNTRTIEPEPIRVGDPVALLDVPKAVR